jgi:hypothetical protein
MMKHALPMQVVKTMPSSRTRGHQNLAGLANDSQRIQGGNWSMQGFRRSAHVFDEDECQMAIAEFMEAHERFDSVD